MKYKCTKCGFVFEGQLDACPNCGKKFTWAKAVEESKNTLTTRNDNKLTAKSDNILDHLRLIRSLYIVARVNKTLSNKKDMDFMIAEDRVKRTENEVFYCNVKKPDYREPRYSKPSPIVWNVIVDMDSLILKFLLFVIVIQFLPLILLIYLIRIIAARISYNRDKKYAKEVNKQLDEKYAKNMEQYKKDLEKFEIEKEKRVANYKKEAEIVKSEKEKYSEYAAITNDAYEKVLEHSIVYDKYKDIIPVCQFIEYLESGRCEGLTGTYGCYNKYEEELRQNLIINRLENIETHLNAIQKNQQVLVKTLRSIESTSVALYNTMQNVETNTEAIASNIIAINECKSLLEKIDEKDDKILTHSSSIDNNLSALYSKYR